MTEVSIHEYIFFLERLFDMSPSLARGSKAHRWLGKGVAVVRAGGASAPRSSGSALAERGQASVLQIEPADHVTPPEEPHEASPLEDRQLLDVSSGELVERRGGVL